MRQCHLLWLFLQRWQLLCCQDSLDGENCFLDRDSCFVVLLDVCQMPRIWIFCFSNCELLVECNSVLPIAIQTVCCCAFHDQWLTLNSLARQQSSSALVTSVVLCSNAFPVCHVDMRARKVSQCNLLKVFLGGLTYVLHLCHSSCQAY